MLNTVLLLTAVALAGERSEREPEPRHLNDLSADTVGKKRARLGLVYLDYGLLKNVQVGTSPVGWILGPNGRAKVTAIQTPKLDVSMEGGLFSPNVFMPEGVTVGTRSVGWTGSWHPYQRFSLHLGNTWTMARVNGTVDAQTMGDALSGVVGGDISADLEEALGDNTYADAEAQVTLAQARLAAEYRFNRRDSLIVQSSSYLWVRGLIAAGVGSGVGESGTVEAGASARLNFPLRNSLPAAASLAWQFDWEHFKLRLGIPLAPRNPFSYTQCLQFYWVLGPEESESAGLP